MTIKKFDYIGKIHSEFKDKEGVPIQGALTKDSKGMVEVFPEYKDGLKDIEGFSHIYLIYEFHRSEGYSLLTKPFLEDVYHGVFATRAPKRPNPIGISIVSIDEVVENEIHVKEMDILDGTPLIDIKPYVAPFDKRDEASDGWVGEAIKRKERHYSDDRFNR
ncbi:MAG: tRNA (N6-threonylcarbamoyladenosine(37)-N6)-methyltransferase TrmO [Candidatus Woesearchaeota archaeon]